MDAAVAKVVTAEFGRSSDLCGAMRERNDEHASIRLREEGEGEGEIEHDHDLDHERRRVGASYQVGLPVCLSD
ncbi:MAG: hypothetical protein IPG50_38745 [Myxococcales bacterium]|nr:hypothetical protein [Myxococcales bacterium]